MPTPSIIVLLAIALVACRAGTPSPAVETPGPVAPPERRGGDAPTDACGHARDDEPPSSAITSLDDLVARKPRSGRFTTEGWAQLSTHCAPCPPDATCKPCQEAVWFSAVAGAYKDPLSREFDLLLEVPDARRFAPITRYRIVLVACDVPSDPAAPLSAELRGFAPLP